MSNFEFQRFVTIGQHLPTGSIIHRLDPRTRLVSGALLVLTITFAPGLLGLGLAVAAVLTALRLARIPLPYALEGLRPPLPFIIILALLQLFLAPQGETATWFAWGPVRLTGAGIEQAALLVLRFVALVLTISLLSFCTATTEIVSGLSALLAPLARLGLPVHDFILMVQVTLRFLPLLAREAERIAKSQAARGADWGTGRGGLLRRTRQALPLLIPLFLTSLRRAENLAVAMEARGYGTSHGEAGRSSMIELRFHAADGVALGLVLALVLGIVLL
ncbi:MAG: energy-coupling factor transporter transmembrane component T family protein [Anaerolineales bacterium]